MSKRIITIPIALILFLIIVSYLPTTTTTTAANPTPPPTISPTIKYYRWGPQSWSLNPATMNTTPTTPATSNQTITPQADMRDWSYLTYQSFRNSNWD
ncbi:MAG TPA: hypothetical protein VLL52_24045, partial [Anaerolineae bacterium]|nr:hypothetical protein [Anaerolineae bacterium]